MMNEEETTSKISNAHDLALRIHALNELRQEQESHLKYQLNLLLYAFEPSNLIKYTIKKVRSNNELQHNAIKATLDLGSSFLLDKLFLRSGVGIKGYIINSALKKLASYLIHKK